MKATILLAEDEQAMREVLMRLLHCEERRRFYGRWLRRTATRRCT